MRFQGFETKANLFTPKLNIQEKPQHELSCKQGSYSQ